MWTCLFPAGAVMARLLQALLLVQLLIVLGLWHVAWRRWHIGPPDLALLLALGMVVLARAAITVNNFWLSWRGGSATPPPYRLRPAQVCRMVLEEFCSTMLVSSWSMLRPGPALHVAARPVGLPVLLVHGYACNAAFWKPWCARLAREHISHYAVTLEPVTAAIDDYAPQLEAALQQLRAASGSAQVVLVCHSMGGLVARAWLRQYGAAHVARIVTLATPHHGTARASVGLGRSARQMRRSGAPGADANPWLQALAAMETPAERALFTSLFSHHDNIVEPQLSAYLPDARNIALAGLGHVTMGRARRTLQWVLAEIGEASASAGASSPRRQGR
ncbi:MAG: alpha/beta fold hydrolase [Pseudomonadota bacterium]